MENNNQDEVKHEHDQAAAQTKKPANGAVIALVIAIILAIVAVGGTWYYMNNNAKNDKKALDEQIQQLQKQVDDLKKQGATKTNKPTATTKTVDEVIAQIVKDVPAKNYAGLSDYMADTIKVVIAASEYQPSVTKAQAIVDMEYLNGGVSPWDFDPTAAELNSYKTGDYKTYLNSAGIFGVASNGYFVAFTLNGSNQISQIFMAVNVELIN